MSHADPVSLAWVVRLRWTSVGALVVLAVTSPVWLPEAVSWGPLSAVGGLMAASNLGLAGWQRSRPQRPQPGWLAPALAHLDVLLVTAALAASGATANPFSFLYLVQVAVGAMVLRPLATWSLVALAVTSYGLLFLVPGPHDAHAEHASHSAALAGHLWGMWIAFALTAPLLAWAVSRVQGALARVEGERAQAREAKVRADRLTGLATLAAGAAHELGTPLGTIAVVAADLSEEPGSVGDDGRLIRAEVARCQGILRQMAALAGQASGEGSTSVSVGALVAAACERLPGADRVVVIGQVPAAVRLPERLVVQALRGLVKNALDASTGPVRVVVDATGGRLRLEVQDDGPGMAPDVLARATEPFFTTKPVGAGLGLGLTFSRTVAEHLGGRLDLQSSPREGTRARLELPVRVG